MEQPVPDAANVSNATVKQSSNTFMLLVKQLRPKQWVKNLIVFAPVLFSGKFNDLSAVLAATACTAAFCMVSSGIYVLNDVIDVEADRNHPTKRNRPIASGRLNIHLAGAVGTVVLLAGLVGAFAVRPALVMVFIGYMALNVLYSIKLKNIVIIDIFSIAAGFVLRAVAGAVAVKVVPSSWFLLCTSLGALYVAMDKRRQELKVSGGSSSATHRRVLAEYSPALLDRMEGVILPSLLTAYSFYSFQSEHGNWMMITVPIVLYGLMRYQSLSEQGTITGAPEDVFWRDRPIQLTLLLWVLTCALVLYADPGSWVNSFGTWIDSYTFGGH
jgi:4-hydroxybenzoate polyprenyltransferase